MKEKNAHSAQNVQKIVPDTSVIISGILSDLVKKGELKGIEIIIPEFVVEELRSQASRGREIGFKGLRELKEIRALEEEKKLTVIRTGRRQTMEEIQLAKYGRIDGLIVDVAKQEKAVLYTSDRVQHLVAEAEGVVSVFFEPYQKKETVLAKMRTYGQAGKTWRNEACENIRRSSYRRANGIYNKRGHGCMPVRGGFVP